MTLLIRAHADVDATSTDGYTPLHYACRAATLAGVELLLRLELRLLRLRPPRVLVVVVLVAVSGPAPLR